MDDLSADTQRQLATAIEKTRSYVDRAKINGGIPEPADSYRLMTEAPEIKAKLTQMRRLLKLVITRESARLAARDIGLTATEEADRAFSVGRDEDGNFSLEIARRSLDEAWGLYNGRLSESINFVRDLVQIKIGKNVITGDELSGYAAGAAGVRVALALKNWIWQKGGLRLIENAVSGAVTGTISTVTSDAFLSAARAALAPAASGVPAGMMIPLGLSTYDPNDTVSPFDSIQDKNLWALLRETWQPNSLGRYDYFPAQVVVSRMLEPTVSQATKDFLGGSATVEKARALLPALDSCLAKANRPFPYDRSLALKVRADLSKALATKAGGL